MEKLAETDLTYLYLRHVVIVVTAVTTISFTPVIYVQPSTKVWSVLYGDAGPDLTLVLFYLGFHDLSFYVVNMTVNIFILFL